MTAKKHILFVMNNLHVGGAEKALVSMLQVFDYDRYDVDLLLFKKEGLFLKQVPEQVNILEAPENYPYFDMPFTQVIRENLWKNPLVIFRRWQFNQARNKATSPAEAEQLGWKPLSKTLEALPQNYDAAIGFLEKNPNYFVVDKVNAKVKLAFIHTDYGKLKMNSVFDKYYFNKVDKIVVVSKESLVSIKKEFSSFPNTFTLIKNIVSPHLIKTLVNKINIDFSFDGKIKIISIGRLSEVKGYSLAFEAFKVLSERNIDFHWIILGDGDLRDEMEDKIKINNLEHKISLLGAVENPYPYLAKADIFLHCAFFEGDGIAVTEAKILNRPIVLTNFETASSHITDGLDGLIVKHDSVEISHALLKLIENESLRAQYSRELSLRHFGTENEIEKLYHLLEN